MSEPPLDGPPGLTYRRREKHTQYQLVEARKQTKEAQAVSKGEAMVKLRELTERIYECIDEIMVVL